MSKLPSLILVGCLALATLTSARGGALELDGNGDYVTFPSEGIPSGAEPFTIEAWVNPDVHADSTITFWGNQAGNQANGFRLKGGGTTRHYFWGNDHDTTGTGDLSSNTSGPNGDGWHHLAITWNGAQTQWYWNGSTLEGPRSASGVSVANANHRIGSRLNAEYFDGLIDEVRIWDKARSGVEIAGDFEQTLTGSEPNLIAYFDFEGDLVDRAGGDNDGTPFGDAAVDVAASAPVGNAGGPVILGFTAAPAALFEGQTSSLGWEVDAGAVAGSLVVEILAPGGAVVSSSPNSTGSFALEVGDTGGTPQTWTYTLRARETGGAMISREASLDIDANPGIPSALPQSLQTTTTTPLAVVLGGSDPNNHPNPSPTFSVVSQPSGGVLGGAAPALTYTADPGFTGTDSFTFKASDGKYDSPAATVTIEVVPLPSPPTSISLSTTNISENVIGGGFVAALSASDPNAGDTHTFSLVAGAGDTDNARFSIVGDQLRAVSGFAGLAGSSYSIRLRALDSGGLGFAESFLLTVVAASDDVVINEIHYNPPENPVRQEFIELHNPAATAADLSGWRLTSAVSFVFPGGTTIPPGGYLVVAEDPATLQATLNAPAIGPFLGNLDSDGETVRLRDANDNIVDEADFKVGFPWPVAADGGGASIELIHPSLDNSLGSSWRASVPQSPLGEATLLPLSDAGWSWRPGATEASAPTAAWRQPAFAEDGSWTPGSQTPIGYGTVNGVPLNTTVTGMRDNYSCLFLRNTFEVAPGEIPTQLRLNYTADDGFVVWINGFEVGRQRFNGGADPSIDDFASSTGVEGAYEVKDIVNPGAFLVEGTNTIAVQLFNASLGSSDLGFDLEVLRPSAPDSIPLPSPGARNTAFAANAAPNIRKVEHLPEQPAHTDPVVITAKITDPEGVASVSLEYQVVAAGSYVPSKLPHPVPNIPTNSERDDNPEYDDPANWTGVVMLDDGSGGDALAGDDIFSVTLPAQAHRTLVRYRITVTDGLGLAARAPYPDDPSLNFAYFVYDGVPAYEGNSAEVMAGTLPVYHLITRPQDYSECIAYNSGDQIPQGGQARFYYNWNGTVVYDGVVYDNVRYRLRGANGRYQSAGKRSMRVRLNQGHYLQARDRSGKKFSQKWRTLTLGKCSSNRLTLTYGLNEAINFYLFDKVGVPAADAQQIHWRVIDGADEAPDAWRGDFQGMYLVTETYDVRFLEEHNLEKGNLYKLINQTTDWEQQQRYQAAFAPSNGADHNTIEGQLDGGDSADYIRAHVNLDKWNRSHALVQAIRHYDYWPSANKNMVYYFEPRYLPENNFNGKLWILPWDTDATWGPTYNAGEDVVYNSLFASGGGGGDGSSTPELWPAYYSEVREIRDLLWQPDQINPLIDEFASFISPLEAADNSRWKNAPADAGNYNGLHGPAKTSLAAYVQDMKNFAFVGGSWDGGGVGAGGRASDLDSIQARNGEGGQIPNTPTITYTGVAGFPTNGLAFESSPFSDPQGNATFGAMEWRIAQITDPSAPKHDPSARFKLEIEADWESGELTTFGGAITPPTIAVRSGLTYRARVRHQDTTGRWSHWSAPVEFTTTLPDISDFLAGLVVTEVMYHPGDPSAAEISAGYDDDDFFEYIELKNVGGTMLDLQDLRFTKGVDFDFLGAAITTLAPGEFALVVNDAAAFEMRYGAGLPVAGEWQLGDKLDNGGEQVKLSFGAGDPIRDFTYDDAAPWPTSPDGSGPSLTLQQPETVPDHTLAASWTAGQPSPGSDDPGISYASWSDAIFGPGNPPGSGELDDADLDGIVNLIEYFSATDPLDAGSSPATPVGVISSAGQSYLTITYTRHTSRPDITDVVEVSTDLTSWDSGAAFTTRVGGAVDNGDGTETVTERSLIPIASERQQYLRVVISTQ